MTTEIIQYEKPFDHFLQTTTKLEENITTKLVENITAKLVENITAKLIEKYYC